MKWSYILTLALLIGGAVAETVELCGYNITFNLSQPYSIAFPSSQTHRDGDQISRIETAAIDSSKGSIVITITESNISSRMSFENAIDVVYSHGPVHSIAIDNMRAWYTLVNGEGINDSYLTMQYLAPSTGMNYTSVPTGKDLTATCMILSDLPLYDIGDFLRSIHIEMRS
jgi:hypothetical protein